MRLIGVIRKVNISTKMIALQSFRRWVYLYFQSGQWSLFKPYLYEGVYMDLEASDSERFTKNQIQAVVVEYVNEVFTPSMNRRICHYSKRSIHTSLSNFLSSLGNIMFLDLEMTMPPYHYNHRFQPEIIQAGFLLVNGEGEEIFRYSSYIRPSLSKNLNRRVQTFLNIDEKTFFQKAVPYEKFYEEFNEVLTDYHPAIVIYGKNDSIILNQSYDLHHRLPLNSKTRFVNLCQLIKNFYDLRNEPGLFKMYQLYYDDFSIQLHDAFNDSEVTCKVFQAFKKEVQHLTSFYDKVHKELWG